MCKCNSTQPVPTKGPSLSSYESHVENLSTNKWHYYCYDNTLAHLHSSVTEKIFKGSF